MTDEQLYVFLLLIVGQLRAGIEEVEKALPEEFKIKTGGSHVFLNPERIDIPVLKKLYDLHYDLTIGLEQLSKEKK